ncbi:hypothetical protein [Amycolatopsis sp. NPDC051071]|uniref:hypothetical protein n=1 Tax=Amycolatopsis sp. NPDC051071 TaxID=3154637 RepID=UPI00343FEEB1
MLPYESAGHLGELRSRLRESHVVVRDRHDVVCVPLAQGAEQIGERRVIASTAGDVLLQPRLLEECLRRILTVEWKYLLRREYPVRFVSRLAGKDLVEQALGRGIDRLHVYPEYSLDVRRAGPREYPGVVIGRKARYEIDLPVDVGGSQSRSLQLAGCGVERLARPGARTEAVRALAGVRRSR